MAGITIKQRQERAAAQAAAYDRSLAAQRHRDALKPDNSSVAYIANHILRLFGERKIRDMSTFRSIKTKDSGARRLAIASHLFGKFPAPRHLQEVWTTPVATAARQQGYVRFQHNERAENERNANGFKDPEELARIDWYIAVATGGSLHKLYGARVFTKKETHAFINCPLRFTFREAMIYAYGKSHTDDVGILTRLAKSKLAENLILTNAAVPPLVTANRVIYDRRMAEHPFWKDVVRFFAVNPVPIARMNDLLDFLAYRFQEDHTFNLKGRNVESLTGQMQQWHRDLGRVKRMGNRTWNGIDIPDSIYEKNDKIEWRKDSKWSFRQLKTSKTLADEGNKMHHCVYSYQSLCITGKCAIWSLTRNDERAITLEMRGNDVVQIRGYANRPARPHEMDAIRQWAADHGVQIGRYAY